MPLEIVKLSSRIGNCWVLRDIEFTATEGRIFGICGGTASGKTTLINAIAGIGSINGGTVRFDEKDITTISAAGRGFTRLTGVENTGLKGLLGRTRKDSAGEQQLAAFTSAAEGVGKVLLLDDAFDRMDACLRQDCFEKVRSLAAGGRIVIFASSDFAQIACLADEMAVLDRGEIKQAGAPQGVYDNPETSAAAALTGEINLIEARRLTSTNAELPEFQTIEGSHRLIVRQMEKSRLGAINKNMTLAIRPEQISMSMGASFPGDNLLKAVVNGIRPLGETSLIEFDASGLRLVSRVFKVVGLAIGDECMLSLPPGGILILRD